LFIASLAGCSVEAGPDEDLDFDVEEASAELSSAARKDVDAFLAAAVGAPGAGDEAALAKVQGRGKAAVDVLVARYKKLPAAQGWQRWMVVRTLALTVHPSSLPFFQKLLTTKVGPEKSKDPHLGSSVMGELTVRHAALGGVGLLYGQGNTKAEQLLLSIARQPAHPALRREAAQVYLQHSSDVALARERLTAVLPQSELAILNIHSM
jgi:hypothetical protein